ncbi:sirohydrochlorin cobaltochelatase [Methanotrichaceae archaeon Mx]|uniref:Sirohydrochlorin cobaltochelatase n=1 Tax=Candidatus Methanocrinis natronophilus TaxID=3033396 RepID=A0ABT5X5X5_9EURY|nr:sirohydrochlorin cobaltochelatase [Candidatus Methanocrinis natronophilus]
MAYGSLDFEARKTYEKIRAVYRREFESPAVEIAFTAGFIRRRLAGIEGTAVESPLTALAKLHDAGHEDVVVQSLHVAPGSEFHEAAALVSALGTVRGKFGFRRLAMGPPLLAAAPDYDAVSKALAPEFDRTTVGGVVAESPRDPEETAVVLRRRLRPDGAGFEERLQKRISRDDRRLSGAGGCDGRGEGGRRAEGEAPALPPRRRRPRLKGYRRRRPRIVEEVL